LIPIVETQRNTEGEGETILYQFLLIYFLSMIEVIYTCLLNHQYMHKSKQEKEHSTPTFLHGYPMWEKTTKNLYLCSL